MQKISFTINHLTGRGWQDTTGTTSVDETIGLKAGRDEFATARGTVKNWAKANLVLVNSTRITIKRDGVIVSKMTLNQGKWENEAL